MAGVVFLVVDMVALGGGGVRSGVFSIEIAVLL
jgi:hypothetical protein